MNENIELDYFSRPNPYSEHSLLRVKADFASECNCSVEDIAAVFNREDGYYFYYKSVSGKAKPIGEMLWDRNRYSDYSFYRASIMEVREEIRLERIRAERAERARAREAALRREEAAMKRKKAKKRKLALQKGVQIGCKLGKTAIAALIVVGAIRGGMAVADFFVQPDEEIAIVQVQPAQDLNTITSANDLLLVAWANSTMVEISDAADVSPYDGVKGMASQVKDYDFLPVVQNYYNYLDQVDSGLPYEIIGETQDRYHNDFRNAAYSLNESLENGIFSNYTFDKSVYANAILVDTNGNVITCADSKETYDSEGNLITFDDSFMTYVLKPDSYEGETFVYNGMEFVELSELNKSNGLSK